MIYVGPLLAASGASGPLAPILLGVGSAFMGLRSLLGGGGSDPQRAVNEFNKYLRDNGIDPGNTTMEDYERLMRRLSIAGPLISPWGSPLYDLSGNMNPEHPEYRSQQGSGGIYGEDLNTQYGGVDRPPYWDYETGQWTIPVDVVSSGQDAVDRWMQRWGPWVAGGAAVGTVGGALAGGGTGAATTPAPPEPPVTPEPETPIHQPGDPQLQDPSQRGQRPPSNADDPVSGRSIRGQIGAALGGTLPQVGNIRVDVVGAGEPPVIPPVAGEYPWVPPITVPTYEPPIDTGITFRTESTARADRPRREFRPPPPPPPPPPDPELPEPPEIKAVPPEYPYQPPIDIPGPPVDPVLPIPPVRPPGVPGLPNLPGLPGFPGFGGGDGYPAGAPQPPGFIGNIGGSKTLDTLMRMQYEPQFVPSLGYFLGRGGR